jgi:hypothetical protein
MKHTYEVEFRRTSFVTYTVQASSVEEAEFIAYQELNRDGSDNGFADWTVESVEKMPGENTK